MRDPQIWYAIDEDSPGGITPLPASPLLLPAALLAGLFGILGWLFKDRTKYVTVWNHRPTGVSREQYLKDREYYQDALLACYHFPNEETCMHVRRSENPDWAPYGWKWTETVPANQLDGRREV